MQGPNKYITIKQACEKQRAIVAISGKFILANIYAVVIDWTAPRKTKGSDHCANLYIVDPSVENEDRVEVLLFGDQAKLPDKITPGDVIRLQQVTVQQYGNKPQMIGKLYRNGAFKLCLWHKAEHYGDVPYLMGQSYSMSEEEKQLLLFMRQFSARRMAGPPTSRPLSTEDTYLRSVCDLKACALSEPPVLVDIICKVLSLDYRDEGRAITLHVWDGTDAVPVPPEISTREPLPPGAQLPLLPISMRRQALPLDCLEAQGGRGPVLTLPSPPFYGSSVPVIVPPEVMPSKEHVGPGSWVKLKMVGPFVVQGQLQLMWSNKSKITPRDPSTLEEKQRRYTEREGRGEVQAHAPKQPELFMSRLVGSDTINSMAVSTIRQVLMACTHHLPGIFRVHARVLRYHPSSANHILLPLQEMPMPPHELSPSMQEAGAMFALKLMLEDATGQMDVVLLGKDAELFFGGTPRTAQEREQVVARLEHLSKAGCRAGEGAAQVGGASGWIDCCVKVGYLRESSPDVWRMPMLRLVQTALM
mmetsp:Transcript_37696/g.83957  ORF Transcript_37696/g.83957 Transcript_37696/m.83957 type:complete len:530 (+) Transcript_37696:78-1667(+)|eukprot:CAMPEP_0202918014 /NCGR_PEP_ID=MMETSP1392-20130828/72430_1 /ASSEMBLY_ACC=CAM_ASM_000868 /TAXON_ID=225041 /ORGANISM="Chlamydomonas chlamydogama, Strain SAG 11-48b" /LENGTH=529 /DNA_ID=CAMNT_0049610941 /DNA_START=1 /DNA_END=1590 /DNA_ORIENTATION=+